MRWGDDALRAYEQKRSEMSDLRKQAIQRTNILERSHTQEWNKLRELIWVKCLEWTPKMRQSNKTQFSANGELCHGTAKTEVHAGV